MDEKRTRLRNITQAGIFAALICIVTYFVKIPVPRVSAGAYINLGDTVIYIVAALIDPIYAMLAAGIGSGLADLFYGGFVYIPATVIIKGLMGFVCAKIAQKGTFTAYYVACTVGGLIMLVGYGLFETILVGYKVAISGFLFNLIQFSAGILLALPIYFIINRIKTSTKTTN